MPDRKPWRKERERKSVRDFFDVMRAFVNKGTDADEYGDACDDLFDPDHCSDVDFIELSVFAA